MEPFTNEQQAVLEKAIVKFLQQNKELSLRRIIGSKDMDYQTEKVRMKFTEDGSGKGKIVFERLTPDMV